MLEDARRRLPPRATPADLEARRARGALIVDTRPAEQRARDGDLEGAVVIDRNVLEWRLDPTSPHRIPRATGEDQEIVVVCNEGYSSSLAALSLHALGLHRATDLEGGFQAILRARAGHLRYPRGVGIPEDLPERSRRSLAAGGALMAFLMKYGPQASSPGACDFLAGNPTELPMPEYIEALQKAVVADSPGYYRYGPPWQPAIDAVARALGERLDLAIDPQDVFLTRGAASGLVLLLRLLVERGDEVLMMSPPWFFYESLVLQEGGEPVKVPLVGERFDLDLAAIEAAITPKTRIVLINTPHNPSGRIYPLEVLAGLARILEAASVRTGRRIFLVSDEAYARILFTGARMVTPAHAYPATFMLHTYSKSLLAPMQRAGYVAMAPTMPEREALRMPLLWASLTVGAPPDTGMQHAMPELERMMIDLPALERRRDAMVAALRGMGYALGTPEAGFYLFIRTPGPDAGAFCDWLAERRVFTLPGEAFERPGYFRISLTATDEMVEQALPILQEAIRAFGG